MSESNPPLDLPAGISPVTLRALFAQLPDEQRNVLELAAGQGLTYDEIARRTGVNGRTIQRRMLRALLSMHEQLVLLDQERAAP